jgi:hypothetical protein
MKHTILATCLAIATAVPAAAFDMRSIGCTTVSMMTTRLNALHVLEGLPYDVLARREWADAANSPSPEAIELARALAVVADIEFDIDPNDPHVVSVLEAIPSWAYDKCMGGAS